jgi:uncharacterized protein (DUF433 family)
MTNPSPSIIRRPDKGLTISGTRITIYAIMDYLRAGWTRDNLREWLNLSDEQVSVALDYIAAHQQEVEAEYQTVLNQSEARRRYWEEQLRQHLARTPPAAPSPQKAALTAKLAEQRRRLIQELLQDEESAEAMPS